jgi:PAS domain S-box-containing protein
MPKLRRRYTLLVTLTYLLFGFLWITLSDILLFNFMDVQSMILFSAIKGVFFVVVSALGFFVALSFMPQEDDLVNKRLRDVVLAKNPLIRTPIPIKYFFAVSIVLLIFLLRTHLGLETDHRPLMILFMLPILLSALFGGFGPGMVATVLAALLVRYIILEPEDRIVPPDSYDLLQWSILIFCGVTVSIFCEVLERIRAKSEKDLNLLNFLVANTNDAIYVKSTDGTYQLINQAAADLVGKPIEEILNKNDTFLFSEDVATKIMYMDRKVLNEGYNEIHEQHLVTKHGKTVVVDVNKGPIYDDEGKVIGLFGISRDITSNKEREKERINQEIILRKSLVREVHHRIKNNLQGATGLLEQTKSNHPEISDDINNIISQIKSIAVIHGLQGQNVNSDIFLLELLNQIVFTNQSTMGKTISVTTSSEFSNWILVESEAVPIALTINELVLNSLKHQQLSDNNQVKVKISENNEKTQVTITITNNGYLNLNNDSSNVGLSGNGLGLVKLLLPKSGVEFKLDQIENTVSASLILSSPIIQI